MWGSRACGCMRRSRFATRRAPGQRVGRELTRVEDVRRLVVVLGPCSACATCCRRGPSVAPSTSNSLPSRSRRARFRRGLLAHPSVHKCKAKEGTCAAPQARPGRWVHLPLKGTFKGSEDDDEAPDILYARLVTADPLAFAAGLWQGDVSAHPHARLPCALITVPVSLCASPLAWRMSASCAGAVRPAGRVNGAPPVAGGHSALGALCCTVPHKRG